MSSYTLKRNYFTYNEALAQRISGALNRSSSLRNSNTVNMLICGKLLLFAFTKPCSHILRRNSAK